MGGATLTGKLTADEVQSFNAARGFVGGATITSLSKTQQLFRFNAARGFVGGANGRAVFWLEKRTFQCRTRLCGWCKSTKAPLLEFLLRFNAARGFVGGAMLVYCKNSHEEQGFNAARGFVGGANYGKDFVRRRSRVSMPHAALWVVQKKNHGNEDGFSEFQCRTRLCGWCNWKAQSMVSSCPCFNAARGFVGGARYPRRRLRDERDVSMPHAALWVVQLLLLIISPLLSMFQCRTRLCGWCKQSSRRNENLL